MSEKNLERVRFNAFLLLDTVEILGTYRYSGKKNFPKTEMNRKRPSKNSKNHFQSLHPREWSVGKT